MNSEYQRPPPPHHDPYIAEEAGLSLARSKPPEKVFSNEANNYFIPP